MSGIKAAERAYSYTKERILRGELAGGERLSEGRICDELELSRTPVHEAFLRLESERLITLSSRQGAVVVPMPVNEVRDVLEMREALERAAVARIAAAGIGGIQEALRPSLERQRGALKDPDAFVEADCDFHLAVVALSGNRIAAQFYDLLRDRQMRMFHQVLTGGALALDDALAEHEELADRLAAHDAPGYGEALARHLARHQGVL